MIQNFLGKCLHKDPLRRATVDELLMDPFVNSYPSKDHSKDWEFIDIFIRPLYNKHPATVKLAITQVLAKNMTEIAQERVNEHLQRLDPGLDLFRLKQMWYYAVCIRNSLYVDSVFDVFDDDSDGFIDVDEFGTVFDNETIQNLCLNDMDHWKQAKSNRCTLMNAWVRAMIKEVDLDKDGKLSRQEFVNAMSDHLDWSVVHTNE